LHVLPDAGHQLMLERPAELADLLEAFRKRISAA
jgi:pimeloyl-ACP methyl ester carboxylesterase